jgi:putative ABC transport system permease protein
VNPAEKKSYRLGLWFLSRLINRRKNYGLFGDIEEIFSLKAAEKSRWKASCWLWGQIIRTIIYSFHDSIYWNFVMFHNYWKVTIRNFRRQKAYSLINIAGLAVGMASCILIMSYVYMELSYDKYHTHAGRIYRLIVNGSISGREVNFASTNNPAGPAFVQEYPEVENAVRFRCRYRTLVKVEDRTFIERRIFWADASVFDVFSFPLVIGDSNTALKNPFTAVITKSASLKYFGKDDPIGKVLRLDDQADYTVTGVMRDVPENSHFRFDMLLSFATRYVSDKEQTERWMGDFSNHTYLLLREDADYKELEKKFPEQVEKHMGEILRTVGWKMEYFLQPLTSIHLHSKLDGEIGPTSDVSYLYIFSGAALFILILACINFMNLATARSTKRAKEVGMRKVHGAEKGKLIKQFFGESLIYSFFSLVIAIIIVETTLPLFRNLSGLNLELGYLHVPWLIPGLIGLAILVGFAAGSYPALYLSRFQPAQVLKGNPKKTATKSRLRNSLVIFQFSVSLVLIIGTIVIFNQLNFMKTKRLGFDTEQIITLQVTNDRLQDSLDYIKQEFRKLSGVKSVALSSHIPGWGAMHNVFLPEGFELANSQAMGIIHVDHDFLSTMGIELAAGRDFSQEFPSDPAQSVIINETAAKTFGWDKPVGKKIQELDGRHIIKTVIGVVKDYHIVSVRQAIEPLLISNSPEGYEVLVIKTVPGSTAETLNALEKKWKEIAPGMPFEFDFLGDRFNSQYDSEERLSQIFSYFSLLAIFIACLGLFGMAAHSVEQRTKEISVRKVLGASQTHILLILNKDLVKLCIFASLIAWPLAYLFAKRWLQEFAYRTSLSVWIFTGATLLVLVVGILTVSYQSFKAAWANPVESLRYE